MNETELDDKIHQLLADVLDSAPESPPFPLPAAHLTADSALSYVSDDVSRRRHPRGFRWVLGAAAAVLLVVAGVVLWSRGMEDSSPPAGPITTGDEVTVTHETWRYVQTSDLTCPDGQVSGGDFTTSTFEVWNDADADRTRHDIVYPDGSMRSVLQLRATARPPAPPLWAGEERGELEGCKGAGIFLTEPGVSYPETFASPIQPGPGAPVDAASRLERVVGVTTDSTGRPAEVWRNRGGGYIESIGPLAQHIDYFVEPGTGLLLERDFTQEIDGFGTVTQRFTLVERQEELTDANIFDPDTFTDVTAPDTVPSSQFEEEGTCARGGTGTVCLIRDGERIAATGAGLAPGTSVEVRLRFDEPGLTPGPMDLSIAGVPIRVSNTINVRDDGTIDSDVGVVNPTTTHVIAGVSATSADQYPLNSSLGLMR